VQDYTSEFIYKPPQNKDTLPPSLKFLDNAWITMIESSPQPQLQEEWGSSQPVRFGGLHVTLHDSEGEEIEIPKCPKCDVHMCQVIGKESFQWICLGECDNG
jgi:hypothetical protein